MINWKKGRGKLGLFEPLLVKWICNIGSKERMKPQVFWPHETERFNWAVESKTQKG